MNSPEQLAQRNAELEALLDEQASANARAVARFEEADARFKNLHAAYMELLATCKRLERGILAQQSRERLSPENSQLTLGILETLLRSRETTNPAQTPVSTLAPGPGPKPRPTGRRPLPQNLPRIQLVLYPPEVEREGLDAFEVIGREVSETLERRPSSLVIVEEIRPKVVRKGRDRLAESTPVFQAEPLDSPIPRGLAGPGMLADTIVKRFDDHMPLHRLERVYGREGIELNRSTICGWHAQLSALILPLIIAMWKDAKDSPFLHTDATGVLVLQKEKCANGHFWVVIAPGLHVLFAYSRDHDSAAVDRILGDYKGTLVADAHSVYDHLYRGGKVLESNCWAHSRRYFFKALGSDRVRALEALTLINALFDIERTIADAPLERRFETRQVQSKPIVSSFYDWCASQSPSLVDGSPLARAVTYATNQRVGLERFLLDARLPIHNNASERELRREACGRNNWIFLGADSGGDVNASFVSLIASCRLHGIEPWAYLRDLFCLIPSWPQSRVLELAPAYWEQTLKKDDTQQRLAASAFRNISAGLTASHKTAL